MGNEVEALASSIGCAHESLPFTYLGLPVGKRLNSISAWNEVIDCLPIYYLSLLKAPMSIINLLESIRSRFFWGFKDSQNSISWVKWRSILHDLDKGGLGVGSLMAKNLGLLAKWKWRFLCEKNALWRLVIKEFYGDDGGFPSSSNSFGVGGIWCDILKVVSHICTIDNSFNSSFVLKVLNGLDTLFWKDTWAYGDLEALINFISNTSLSSNEPDKWSWTRDTSGNFKVKVLVKSIQEVAMSDSIISNNYRWNSWIPRKVNICVWRASLNRLPTRSNLSHRGITLPFSMCPLCDVDLEIIEHCCINYPRVLMVWRKVWTWWNINLPHVFPSFSVSEIAAGLVRISGCSRINKILHGVLCCTIWAIWKWRNRIVNSDTNLIINLLDEDIFPSIQLDGIYPELVTFVKTIPEPSDDDHKRIRYKQMQEAAMKDVERAFGVLKKKWAILANPARPLKKERIMDMMYTCIILLNMIRKDKGKIDISQLVLGGSTSTGRPRTIR
ncbi:RNA-directed DNA polymerase, eukaryota, reverse transcriptase zinc-binding domain protein [Tanacetum coccineum]